MYNSDNSNPTLTNITFSGNSAISHGGGIYNYSSNPTLHNVILWGNTAPNFPQITDDDSTTTISDSVVQGGYDGGTNIITTDPLLGTLGDYGGSSQTIPLLAGSSAIDATSNNCPATDQRGWARPADGDGDSTATCDIGAYEEAGEIQYFAAPGTFTFSTQSGVQIEVSSLGTDLGCLFVDEKPVDHPEATDGIKTGEYWTITGLQSNGVTTATQDYILNLTLPHSELSDPEVCKYTDGPGGYEWDCYGNSSTTITVTRNGISSLSDWAVGDQGPSAIMLRGFGTHIVSSANTVVVLAALTLIVSSGLVLVLWRRCS